jgi:hypothetical protein
MFICKINIQSGIIYGIITMYQIWLTGISILTNHWPICVAHTTQNSHYGNFAFCVVWATHISFLVVLSAVPPFLSYAQKPKPVYMSTNFNDAAVYLFHNLFCFKLTNSLFSLKGEIKTINNLLITKNGPFYSNSHLTWSNSSSSSSHFVMYLSASTCSTLSN